MHITRAFTPIAAVVILSLGGMAIAQTGSSPSPTDSTATPATPATPRQQAPRGQHRQQWIQQLNLTPDQVQKLESIRGQYKPQMEQAYSTLRQARRELLDLMASNTATDSQIREKHQQIQTLQQQLSDTRFEQLLAMRNVLNAEQRTQAAQLLEQRHHGWGDRMDRQEEPLQPSSPPQ
jgi:Spy/CpxP family protein refolding chaperone